MRNMTDSTNVLEKPTKSSSGVTTLRNSVAKILHHYFSNLAGENPCNVYDFVLDEVEEPLLRVVMKQARGNQSKMARILGISRGTLRIKLKKFDMMK
jgi:Fis family transcriptional regulator